MANEQLYVTLKNGRKMPLVGLGVFELYGKEAERVVTDALEIGYRLIDTAAMYGNEKEVGNAIRQSGINRSEVFVITKVNNSSQGFDNTLKAFDESMQKLGIEYIDLYLIHWPVKEKRKDTWKALEQLLRNQQVRAIGVANYLVPFLEELSSYGTVVPALNQVEFTPYLFLKDLLIYCREKGIQLQAYSPLARGEKFTDERLLRLAARYGKTPAQVMLRWCIEHGVSVIPKTSGTKRLQENFAVFDFTLSAEDVEMMNGFHENFRVVEDPMDLL